MIVPSLPYRRVIDKSLSAFFRSHRPAAFRRAISDLCRFYNVKRPRIEWYEYIDWGKTAGKTYEDGRIHLVHPENWKRGRVYNSERKWIQTIYHEMGHYLFWTDAERKADAFTHRMVQGLRAMIERAARTGSRRKNGVRRPAAVRSRSRKPRIQIRSRRARRARA